MSRSLHRFIFALCALVGLWSAISFFGAVFAPEDPGTWLLSLAAAVASGLLLIPTIIVTNQLVANRSETPSDQGPILPHHALFTSSTPTEEVQGDVATRTTPNQSLWPSE